MTRVRGVIGIARVFGAHLEPVRTLRLRPSWTPFFPGVLELTLLPLCVSVPSNGTAGRVEICDYH